MSVEKEALLQYSTVIILISSLSLHLYIFYIENDLLCKPFFPFLVPTRFLNLVLRDS